VHPLVPGKGRPIHVERGDRKAFELRDALVVEELGYFEYPAKGIVTIKPRDIELQVVVARRRGWRYVVTPSTLTIITN